jgi:CO dehydrogenase maturation factor
VAAKRIRDLTRELNLDIKKDHLITNRVAGELPAAIRGEVEAAGLHLAGCVPEDALVSSYDAEGRPTVELPDHAGAVQALDGIFEAIIPQLG